MSVHHLRFPWRIYSRPNPSTYPRLVEGRDDEVNEATRASGQMRPNKRRRLGGSVAYPSIDAVLEGASGGSRGGV